MQPVSADGVAARPPSRLRTVLLYGGVAAFAIVVLWLVLHAGGSLHAPKAAGGKEAAGPAASAEKVIWRLLLASVVILVVARLVGAVFQKINQPQVVGEIVAGIVLGPSVLGAIWPGATSYLFPDSVLPFIDALSQVGLIFFMFLIGLELDVRLIKGRGRMAATVSQVSIVMPFLLGSLLALALFPTLGSATGRFTPFALFMGASMSITAFPVLARILTERGIYKSPLGAVSLTCAAVDDVSAWCLLAVVVAIARSANVTTALRTIVLASIFIAFMILLVRPVVARLARYHEEQGQLGVGMLAMLFVGVLLSALATDRIGIHAIFGAFLFGAIMPQRSEFIGELTGKLEDFTVVFLLPLFFAFNGLRTDLGLLGSDRKMWAFCGLILLVAVAGKWGGSSVTARLMGLRWREAMSLGILMNTRGLTELVILNIGLDLGVIPPTLFAMLVVMALLTTFMTTPLLSLFYRAEELEEMSAAAEGEEAGEAREGEGADGADRGPRRFRILVPIAKGATAHELVHTAMRLARDSDEHAEIILLRVAQLPGSAYRAGPRYQEQLVRRASQVLRPLVQLVEGAGYQAVPVVVPARDVAGAIVNEAKARRPDLVLLGWHRSLWGNRLLGGAVGEVLRRATADVAVVVDPNNQGLGLRRNANILVPYGGGYHEDIGVELALRLAQASGATITLIGPVDGAEEAHKLADRAARAYGDTGVWTIPAPVPAEEPGKALVDRARGADLVVLGMGDEWVRNQDTLGGLREAVAARTSAPLLIVRRHGQKGRLRRQREWIVDTGELDLRTADVAADRLG